MPELLIRHMDNSRTDIQLGLPHGPQSWDHTGEGLVVRWSQRLGWWKVFPWATVKSYTVYPSKDQSGA